LVSDTSGDEVGSLVYTFNWMGRSAHDLLIGRTIAGKFVIDAPIGAGAMGAVFRARQVALEKTVAIKVLHGEHAGDASFVARFQREAKAASRLNHPNSMQVIDFGAGRAALHCDGVPGRAELAPRPAR
jgi:serine/threonine protein kinase